MLVYHPRVLLRARLFHGESTLLHGVKIIFSHAMRQAINDQQNKEAVDKMVIINLSS